MNDERILLVDDEPHVLAALERGLRGRFVLETCSAPREALALVAADRAFGVVVSDMRMPEVDGVELLTHVSRVSPDTARVMLTGNSDQLTAARAVNEGAVFRFLTKPCAAAQLGDVLDAALEHHRRLRAERELLEHTLRGAVELLTDVLELVDPSGFGAAQRLREQAGWIARHLKLDSVWEVEMAALMSQLGWISLPPETRAKEALGQPLNETESELLGTATATAARLVRRIPRLEGVADVLDEVAKPAKVRVDEIRPATIVAQLLRFAAQRRRGLGPREALLALGADLGNDRRVLHSLSAWIKSSPADQESATGTVALRFHELRVGMITAAPIETSDGRTLLSSGQRLSTMHYERICNHQRLHGVREPILMHSKVVYADSDEPASSS